MATKQKGVDEKSVYDSGKGEEVEEESEGETAKERLHAFGFAWPILESILGLVLLAAGMLALNYLNGFLGSTLISAVSSFLYTNIGVFFGFFLFAGYNEYLHRRYHDEYWAIAPVMAGIAVAFALWLAAWAANLISAVPQFAELATVFALILANITAVLLIVIALGYAFVIAKHVIPRRSRR
jgi:hypothetical protein